MATGETIKKAKPASFGNSLFDKFADSYHFNIENHRHLKETLELDEALWIATTALCSTLKTDKTFLELLDSDQDDRLRVEEIEIPRKGPRH